MEGPGLVASSPLLEGGREEPSHLIVRTSAALQDRAWKDLFGEAGPCEFELTDMPT